MTRWRLRTSILTTWCVAALVVLPPQRGWAQASSMGSTRAAFLFGYRPHPGMERQFHDGYRRHLEWHRIKQDTLTWYGWEVLSGDRPGVFVDGTFGRPFLALDRRVDPAGDERDLAANVAPFAQLEFRSGYVVREDLSTGMPLEDGRPSILVEVIKHEIRPGTEHGFESVVRAARQIASSRRGIAETTWYQLVNGGVHGTYLQMVHRNGMAGWDSHRMSLSELIFAVEDGGTRDDLLRVLSASVGRISSELWRYLPQSSLTSP